MSLLDRIPIPENGIDSFLGSANMMQNLLAKKAQSQLPFGGRLPPGAAGQVVGLEMMKNLYGENSPQYQKAKDLFDLNNQSIQSRVNYQNILSESAPKRFSTNFGKTQQELKDIKEGNFPGTKIPFENEEEKNALKNQYEINLIKSVSDPNTRQRLIYSTNIDKTLDQLNPESLTSYSGGKGQLELLADKISASSGSPSQRYIDYTNALQGADLLAKQVRQFYGDSVTPTVQEGLKKITNPNSWSKDPKTALENFNHFVKILKSEQETFKDAISKSSTFTGKKEGNEKIKYGTTPESNIESVESEESSPKIERTKEINGNQYVFFDNSWHKVKR